MSNYIFKLLEVDESTLTENLKKIEEISHQPAVDIKLSFAIQKIVTNKVQSLNLKQDAKTSSIYRALIDEMLQINKMISPNIATSINSHQFIIKLNKWFSRKKLIKKGWFVKDQVLKKKLQKLPPKRTIVNFGYHTVNSLLRGENLAEIMVAVDLFESDKWRQAWIRACQDLKPSDFQFKSIQIINVYKSNIYRPFFTDNPNQFYAFSPLSGSILPKPLVVANQPAPILTSILHLLEAIRQVLLFSTWFKVNQPNKNFGKIIAETLDKGWPTIFKMADQPVTWPIITYYFQKIESTDFSDILDPHISAEDLQLATPLRSLSKIVPIFINYEEIASCGLVGSEKVRPTSFHLLDLTIDTQTNMIYNKHSVKYFQEQLMNELWSHYLDLPIFNRQLIDFLNSKA